MVRASYRNPECRGFDSVRIYWAQKCCVFSQKLLCFKYLYYTAQATFCKIACSDWLRRVTCRSVSFRIAPVRITGFVSHFVYKGTTKGNFKKPQKFNEFNKLSTCMSRAMNYNLKESFTVMKAITTRTTIWKITIMSRYTYVRYVKKKQRKKQAI